MKNFKLVNSIRKEFIYHIVSKKEFIRRFKDGFYVPLHFDSEGFIHCSDKDQVLAVADAFYQDMDDAILLKIRTDLLQAELKYEDPIPVKKDASVNKSGNNIAPQGNNPKFPHIYGFLNGNAIVGYDKLEKKKNHYLWPEKFYTFNDFLIFLIAGLLPIIRNGTDVTVLTTFIPNMKSIKVHRKSGNMPNG